MEVPSELVLTYVKIIRTLGKKGTERGEGVPVHVQGCYLQGSSSGAGATKALWLSEREGELEQVRLPGYRVKQAGRIQRVAQRGLAPNRKWLPERILFPKVLRVRKTPRQSLANYLCTLFLVDGVSYTFCGGLGTKGTCFLLV